MTAPDPRVEAVVRSMMCAWDRQPRQGYVRDRLLAVARQYLAAADAALPPATLDAYQKGYADGQAAEAKRHTEGVSYET